MTSLDDYIKNGFPESKIIDRETRDHICRLCGEWVTIKSSCGKRYFEFQGRWINGQPKCDPSIHHTSFEHVPTAIVPICDSCFTEKYVKCDFPKTIIVLGCEFYVYDHYRAND